MIYVIRDTTLWYTTTVFIKNVPTCKPSHCTRVLVLQYTVMYMIQKLIFRVFRIGSQTTFGTASTQPSFRHATKQKQKFIGDAGWSAI